MRFLYIWKGPWRKWWLLLQLYSVCVLFRRWGCEREAWIFLMSKGIGRWIQRVHYCSDITTRVCHHYTHYLPAVIADCALSTARNGWPLQNAAEAVTLRMVHMEWHLKAKTLSIIKTIFVPSTMHPHSCSLHSLDSICVPHLCSKDAPRLFILRGAESSFS